MFPLWYLLVIYALFALLAVLFWIFNLAHIAKFGLQIAETVFVIGLYFVVFFLVLGGTIIYLSDFDWNTTIMTSDMFKINLNTFFAL